MGSTPTGARQLNCPINIMEELEIAFFGTLFCFSVRSREAIIKKRRWWRAYNRPLQDSGMFICLHIPEVNKHTDLDGDDVDEGWDNEGR